MKHLITLLIAFTVLSCGGDDEETTTNSLTITIEETAPTSANITWTVPTASIGQTIKYQILLNGTEVANNYSARSYTFTDLQFESDYDVAVYALDNAGNSTFAETNFTTLRNPVGGNIVLSNQAAIEAFNYEEVISLTLVGAGVTDVSNLSILRKVNSDITISSTSLTSLQGLENVIDSSSYPSLNIRNNNLLENIDALSTYSGLAEKITIDNNPVLSDISNLEINDFMRELTLKDFPAADFTNFGTLEIINSITLDNISLNVLTSLSALAIVQDKLEIKNMDFQNLDGFATLNNLDTLALTNIPNIDHINGIGDDTFDLRYYVTQTPPPLNMAFLDDIDSFYLFSVQNSTLENFSTISNLNGYVPLISIKNNSLLQDFNGLDTLDDFFSLSIVGNSSLLSLDGAPQLNANTNGRESAINIRSNPVLTDFCGISTYLANNGFHQPPPDFNFEYTVVDNAYNPSPGQLTSPTECSQ